MEELKLLDNMLVDEELLDEVECSEHVCGFEILGYSSQYPGAIWFDVKFLDGERIDLFCKMG